MTNNIDKLLSNCKSIAEIYGFNDLVIEWSLYGSYVWIKNENVQYNKIELHKKLKNDPNYAHSTFLHALAHFIYHRETNGKRYTHDERFADIFTELVAKHMIVYK